MFKIVESALRAQIDSYVHESLSLCTGEKAEEEETAAISEEVRHMFSL